MNYVIIFKEPDGGIVHVQVFEDKSDVVEMLIAIKNQQTYRSGGIIEGKVLTPLGTMAIRYPERQIEFWGTGYGRSEFHEPEEFGFEWEELETID